MIALMTIISLCNLVTPGHTWSHWSLSSPVTSTMMALVFIMALMVPNWELLMNCPSPPPLSGGENCASLHDLLASPQVKKG